VRFIDSYRYLLGYDTVSEGHAASMKMEATWLSETLESFITTRRRKPEDHEMNLHSGENLKSFTRFIDFNIIMLFQLKRLCIFGIMRIKVQF
jgi:hypothetical protein